MTRAIPFTRNAMSRFNDANGVSKHVPNDFLVACRSRSPREKWRLDASGGTRTIRWMLWSFESIRIRRLFVDWQEWLMVFLVGQICSWKVGTRNMRKEVWNGDEGFGIGLLKGTGVRWNSWFGEYVIIVSLMKIFRFVGNDDIWKESIYEFSYKLLNFYASYKPSMGFLKLFTIKWFHK